MKLYFTKFLVLVIFLVTMPIPSYANSVKINSSCSVNNKKIVNNNKTFICKKNNNSKLVWKIHKQKTKPKQSIKYMEPWATEIDTKIMVDTALRNFSEWVEKNKGNELNHKVFIQEGTNPLFAKMINDVESFSAQMLSKYVPGGTVQVIGKDADWIVNTLRSNNRVIGQNKIDRLKLPNIYNQTYQYEMSHSDWTAYLIYSKGDINRSNFGLMSLPAHEYFHLAQSGLRGKTGHPGSTIPSWFHEGSASFFGYAVASQVFKTNFYDARSISLSQYKPPNTDESLPLKSYEPGPESPNWKYPYNVGRTAIEYIVASVGFESILKVDKEFKKLQNFEKAFENVMGISITEFYKKYKDIRHRVGIPRESDK